MKLDLENRLSDLAPAQRQVSQTALDWGYGNGNIFQRPSLWRGKRILDIGMGGGPHCVPFLIAGAKSYTGVDPLIGTEKVRDLRTSAEKSGGHYSPFPYSPEQMMDVFPNLRLISGYLEEHTEEIKADKPNLITLAVVSEHLADPLSVIKAAYEAAADDAVLWLSHGNYYSWSGHHQMPRSVQTWDHSDEKQNRIADWGHLDPDHPVNQKDNLNRIRLQDITDIISTYFEIKEYRVQIDAKERLTSELRQKLSQFSLPELLGRMVFICAEKRATPLDRDFSDRQFFHPDPQYRADEDHRQDSNDWIDRSNLVYFRNPNGLMSHTYNENAGSKLISEYEPGQRITVSKYPNTMQIEIKEIRKPDKGYHWAVLAEDIPQDILDYDADNWEIKDSTPVPITLE